MKKSTFTHGLGVRVKQAFAALLTLGLVLIGVGATSVAAHATEPIMLQIITSPDIGTATPDDNVEVTVVVRSLSGEFLDGLDIQLDVESNSPTQTYYQTSTDGFAEFSLGTLGPDDYTFDAIFAGNADWYATHVVLTYDVFYNQDDFAVVPLTAPITYGDTGLQLSTEGAADGSSITWEVTDGDDVVSVDSTTGAVTILAAGSATVEAYSSGNATTREASDSYTFTVDQREATVTAFSSPTTIAFGDKWKLAYKVTGLLPSDTLNGSVMLEGDLRLGENAIVEDTAFENPNYSVTFNPGVLTVLPNESQQLAITAIDELPETIADDADVAQLVDAYTLVLALSEDEYAALPEDAIEKLDRLTAQAEIINHNDIASGVTASAETLPWSVKLVASIETDSANDFAAFEAKLPADRALVALYDIHFVDLLTGDTWQPAVGEPVNISLANVDIAGRNNIGVSHMTVASTLENIDATVNGSTIIFDGASFSQYGVTSDGTANDKLVNTGSSASISTVLAAAGLLAGAGALLFTRRRAAAK